MNPLNQKLLDPYVIKVENTTKLSKNVSLFGWNRNWNKPNFGSDKGVKITNLCTIGGPDSDIGYSYVLAESAHRHFKLGLVRIDGYASKYCFEKLIKLVITTGFGKVYIEPQKLTIDPNQFQSNIIDKKVEFIVDAGSEIQFSLTPKETIVFSLYATESVSLSDFFKKESYEVDLDTDYIDDELCFEESSNWFVRNLNKFKNWLITNACGFRTIKIEDELEQFEQDTYSPDPDLSGNISGKDFGTGTSHVSNQAQAPQWTPEKEVVHTFKK